MAKRQTTLPLIRWGAKHLPFQIAYRKECAAVLALEAAARRLVARDVTGDFVRHSDVAGLARALARIDRLSGKATP